MMIVIPAIDLKGGKCVRLLQGREKDVTVYSDDPVSTALKWEALGAELLHVVDLDGAFTGEQRNIESIKAIRRAVKMQIEVGGGIRDTETVAQLVSLGVDRVILGTMAVEDPEAAKRACQTHPGKVLAGIDARDGMAAIKGWVQDTEVRAVDLAIKMQEAGAAGIVYTDISRDGMLSGPNLEAMAAMVGSVDIPVIASGGISCMADITGLLKIKNLWGAITGKAIYSGSLDLKEAIAASKDTKAREVKN